MPTKDPDDELIVWQTNEIGPVEPPPDRDEWVRIIRQTVPARVLVELTTDAKGRWWVSKAEESRVIFGGESPDPIDHRAKVVEALRKAGKPIRTD